MNTKRYPDFKKMIETFHKAGIKVIPNIKPCKPSLDPFTPLYTTG